MKIAPEMWGVLTFQEGMIRNPSSGGKTHEQGGGKVGGGGRAILLFLGGRRRNFRNALSWSKSQAEKDCARGRKNNTGSFLPRKRCQGGHWQRVWGGDGPGGAQRDSRQKNWPRAGGSATGNTSKGIFARGKNSMADSRGKCRVTASNSVATKEREENLVQGGDDRQQSPYQATEGSAGCAKNYQNQADKTELRRCRRRRPSRRGQLV